MIYTFRLSTSLAYIEKNINVTSDTQLYTSSTEYTDWRVRMSPIQVIIAQETKHIFNVQSVSLILLQLAYV